MLLLLRLAGMAAAGFAGWELGLMLAGLSWGASIGGDALGYVLVLAMAGAALGLLLTPYATVVPLRWLWRMACNASAPALVGATMGLLVGLLIAALASIPLALLPTPFGRWLPAGAAALLAWLGLAVGVGRKDELLRVLRSAGQPGQPGRIGSVLRGALLVDTSAVVDGRIVEIWRCGFIAGQLVVLHFVLDELQQLSDSADPAKRQRGRRGLDMLEQLQRLAPIAIDAADYAELRGVDTKLIRLARQRLAAIVTTDYNLNRVASLQGVPVVNINYLANALRSVVVPGEELSLEVVQEGRERDQGIGYLEDGTTVVVEGGRRLVGRKADVEVTRILPTAGGRIVFGRLRSALIGAPEGAESPPGPPGDSRPPGRAALRVVRATGVEPGE